MGKYNEASRRNLKALNELQAQLKQRGYSSRATREILKWYAVGE